MLSQNFVLAFAARMVSSNFLRSFPYILTSIGSVVRRPTRILSLENIHVRLWEDQRFNSACGHPSFAFLDLFWLILPHFCFYFADFSSFLRNLRFRKVP